MTADEFIIWLKGFIEGTSCSRDLTNEEEYISRMLSKVAGTKICTKDDTSAPEYNRNDITAIHNTNITYDILKNKNITNI